MDFAKLESLEKCKFLALAYTDFELAEKAAGMIDGFGLPAWQEKPLLQVIAESAVVRYARPFSINQITPAIRTQLPEYFLDLLSPELRAVHDRIVFLRDRVVAHSDAEWNEIKHFRIPWPEDSESWAGIRGRYEVDLADIRRIPEITKILMPAIYREQQQHGDAVGEFHQLAKEVDES